MKVITECQNSRTVNFASLSFMVYCAGEHIMCAAKKYFTLSTKFDFKFKSIQLIIYVTKIFFRNSLLNNTIRN